MRPAKSGTAFTSKLAKTKEQVRAGPNGSTQNDRRGHQALSKSCMASPSKTADISPRRKQDQRSSTGGQQKPGWSANSRKVMERAEVGEHLISDSDGIQEFVGARQVNFWLQLHMGRGLCPSWNLF